MVRKFWLSMWLQLIVRQLWCLVCIRSAELARDRGWHGSIYPNAPKRFLVKNASTQLKCRTWCTNVPRRWRYRFFARSASKKVRPVVQHISHDGPWYFTVSKTRAVRRQTQITSRQSPVISCHILWFSGKALEQKKGIVKGYKRIQFFPYILWSMPGLILFHWSRLPTPTFSGRQPHWTWLNVCKQQAALC